MKALIIGGGIGGLAAALGLRRAGLSVEVYERAPALEPLGAGLSLWANALRALEGLGMGEAVRRWQGPHFLEGRSGLRRPDGALLVPISPAQLAERFGMLSVGVHRAVLQEVLLEALGREHLHLGRSCTGCEQDQEGVVARFEDGSEREGALLVGADGLNSEIRTALHGPTPPVYRGYTAWRAVVDFDLERLTPGETWGRGARFGQVPLADGRVYWFAARNAPEGDRSPEGEQAGLRQIFSGWHDPIEALIDAADEKGILRNDIYDRAPLDRWGRGRATLLGDAAHPMTPDLGQGACQALEDAYVLARALEGASRDVPAALRAYEDARRRRTHGIVRQSRRAGRIAQLEHPLATALRDRFMKHVAARFQAQQLAPLVGYDVRKVDGKG